MKIRAMFFTAMVLLSASKAAAEIDQKKLLNYLLDIIQTEEKIDNRAAVSLKLLDLKDKDSIEAVVDAVFKAMSKSTIDEYAIDTPMFYMAEYLVGKGLLDLDQILKLAGAHSQGWNLLLHVINKRFLLTEDFKTFFKSLRGMPNVKMKSVFAVINDVIESDVSYFYEAQNLPKFKEVLRYLLPFSTSEKNEAIDIYGFELVRLALSLSRISDSADFKELWLGFKFEDALRLF